MNLRLIAKILFLLPVLLSCKRDVPINANNQATPYQLKVPKNFPQPFLSTKNPLTVEGIKLGRMLYYDPILSSNGLSCSACHVSRKSFSSGIFTTKNGESISVLPHINLAWNNYYNWNGSEKELDVVGVSDFGPDFFNTNMPDLVKKLKAHSSYPSLFLQAFGINDVAALSHEELKLKISYSLAQFMRTMISSESKYDKMLRNEVAFTAEERDGFETFNTERGDCFHCHGYPLFTSNTFNNTGVDANPTGTNVGHFAVTRDSFDIGKFRSPTLRNVELTAPYMHDGRFKTLEEVVEFYNSGVHFTSPNIDPLILKARRKKSLNLTPAQKANLVAFLKTLTDTSFINNPQFSKPF